MSPPAADERTFLTDIGRALGLPLSELQVTRLLAYLDLLARWNETFNLTAVRSREGMLTQHLADCLAIVPALAREHSAGRLLDVGSGGGLPGVVLAICFPRLEVSCADTVGKKAAFVRQVAAELPLPNLRSIHARVERLEVPAFDVIVSRAFASLAEFCGLTAPLLTPGGVWVAMKGRRPDEEIAALPNDVEVFHVEQLQVPGLDAQRCVVWLRSKPRL